MIAAPILPPARFEDQALLRLGLVALGVFLLNLPFGFWRAGLRRFGAAWFVAVHAPVPLAIGLRLIAGVRWHPANLLVLVPAFFTGQFVGGRLRAWRRRGSEQPERRAST